MPLRISGLFFYPLKGGRAIALDRAVIGTRGVEHDRRFMIVDEQNRFVTQRTHPALARTQATIEKDTIRFEWGDAPALSVPLWPTNGPVRRVVVWRDTCDALSLGEDAAQWFRERLGIPCELVAMPDDSIRQVDLAYARPGDRVGFADGFPVLMTCTASLDELNAHLASPMPMDRFRPNVVVAGGAAWQEDTWRRVRIGETEMRVVKGCARCVVTTVDQRTAERGEEPLKTLARLRNIDGKVIFGQNAIPDGTGEIAVGDEVAVIEGRA